MTTYELEEEHHRFIEFGQIFDKTVRIFLVHFIYSRLSGNPIDEYRIQNLLDNHQSRYFEYLQRSLDKMLSSPLLCKVCSHNEALSRQILHDILRWMRETDKKIKATNPYEEENKSFAAWSHKPTFLWIESWYNLTNYLANIYSREELNREFYASKFKTLCSDISIADKEQLRRKHLQNEPEKHALDVVIDDLLAQWDALLTAKNLAYELEEMEKEQEQFTELLSAKAEEFNKLIDIVDPFEMEMTRFWDLSRGLWKKNSFNILDHYQRLLQNEKSVRELADLLGRMRQAQIEMEEEVYEEILVRKEWQTDLQLKSEIGGIKEGNELPHTLPSELALLDDPITETLFLQKYADKSLLNYQYEGKKLVSSDKINFSYKQKQKRKEKGPFILCIDTSGSMEGLPSQIAKVLCFAIMKMAAKEQRKCYLISFSIGIKTINLLDIAGSMDRIIDFLSMSFDGGTDITPALSEALNVLQTADYKDADVMMISDFVMFDIREELLIRIRKEQSRGTQFHSLTLSPKPNVQVVSQFDNYWVYDPLSKGMERKLLESLESIA